MKYGFSKKLLDSIVCQKDGSTLRLYSELESDGNKIVDGLLACPVCEKKYEIKEGFLILIKHQEELDELLSTEVLVRDKQAGEYDERLEVRHFKEVPSTLKKIGDCSSKKIIEYACGTGRITKEIIDKCDSILASDFSFQSLKVLADKVKDKDNIGLVLADATKLKTKDDYFDIAFSGQFIEHIPSKEQRSSFLKNVFNTLKFGGIFVSTIYHYDLRQRIKKVRQEGRHNSGIFFHYFKKKEIKEEVESILKVFKICPIDITLPFENKLKLSKEFAGRLSRFLENIPVINLLGHLLIVKAKKCKKIKI